MIKCNLCNQPLSVPIYTSARPISITSLCEVLPQTTEVFWCVHCAHLQTRALENIEQYYDQTYKILLDSEEEDQLYTVVDSQNIYRVDHQVRTFFQKVTLPEGAMVLDYGCAKAATLRKIFIERQDIVPHLFDVSSTYLPFWENIAKPEDCAIYTVPTEWQNRFDVVMSFFALEHVAQPIQFLQQVKGLLKAEGIFYGIVPNVYANIADFVVLDHVNHFSLVSLRYSLEVAGFDAIEIDATAHKGALVFSARNSRQNSVASIATSDVDELALQTQKLVQYWVGISDRIQEFEDQNSQTDAAIYGSGFYGTFIATCLEQPDRVLAFVDRNPFRQGKYLLERPILDPSKLQKYPLNIYVGLNPDNARQSIARIDDWQMRPYTFCYL